MKSHEEDKVSKIAYEMNYDIIQKAEKDLVNSLSEYVFRGGNPHGMNFSIRNSNFGELLYKSMVKK